MLAGSRNMADEIQQVRTKTLAQMDVARAKELVEVALQHGASGSNDDAWRVAGPLLQAQATDLTAAIPGLADQVGQRERAEVEARRMAMITGS